VLIIWIILFLVPVVLLSWILLIKMENKNCDALIILGSKEENIRKKRVETAIRLLKKREFKTMIVSGGNDEAVMMKRQFKEHGIDETLILIEDRSKDTLQNVEYVKSIMEKQNLKTSLWISSWFHLRRIKVVCNHHNLICGVYAERSVKNLKNEFYYALKEIKWIFITILILKNILKSKY